MLRGQQWDQFERIPDVTYVGHHRLLRRILAYYNREIARRGLSALYYDPGDEIFVFGFSRGAFSAQTFVGFARHVGVLRRLHAARIDEALDLYRQRLAGADGASERMRRFRSEYSDNVCIGLDDEAWRCQNVKDYIAGSARLLTIRYLGLWDTVGALGWPAMMPFSAQLNREHAFPDTSLTPFVESARHAVAA